MQQKYLESTAERQRLLMQQFIFDDNLLTSAILDVNRRRPAPRRILVEANRVARAILDDRLVVRVNPTTRIQNDEQVEAVASRVDEAVNYAAALDLDRRPRLSRTNAENIEVHTRKQADERARMLVLHTAIMWGWLDPCITKTRRIFIGEAACRQVAYDLGYRSPLAATRLPFWHGLVHMAVHEGEYSNQLSPSQAGSKKYVAAIEESHPGYIRELYRYSESVLGALATYKELVDSINSKSASPGEGRPTLALSRRQLAQWFQDQGGKETSAIEKPLLTTEHKKNRVAWAREWFDLFCDPTAPVAFLDEKWFYTTNRRRRLKILPSTADEAKQVPGYKRPRIRSRRYPVKVMFLGVVASPQPEHNFDGRIALDRVSQQKTLSRASRNKRFSVDVLVVEAITRGEWRDQLVTVGMSVDDLLESIKTQYDLDEFVSDRLIIGYYTQTAGGAKKWKTLQPTDILDELGIRTNDAGEQVPLLLTDLELFVQQRRGDEVEEDCSCDSSFMLEIIPTIGRRLRDSFHWVAPDEKIYLFMDNAGGHGTDVAIQQYTAILLDQFNVQVVWQVPRSPETNMLDLGIWMSIQAAVTRVHHMRRCHHDALAKSVMDAWNGYLSPQAFTNVHRRLRVVLSCIVEDEGGNSLVEMKRGKLFRDATIIDLTTDDDELGNQNEQESFSFIDLDELDDISDE
jgi:hypothetical protein